VSHQSGPIVPLSLTRSVARGEETLPLCWEMVTADGPPLFQEILRPVSAQALAKTASTADPRSAFIVVMVRDGLGPLGPAVDAALAAGRRAYLLCGGGFGRDASAREWMKDRQERLLVRRLDDPPAELLLTGRGGRGTVLFGEVMHELCTAGADACFAAFLHLFWARVSQEALPASDGFLFRDCPEAPFDTVEPTPPAGDDLSRWTLAVEPDPDRLGSLQARLVVVNPFRVTETHLARFGDSPGSVVGTEDHVVPLRMNGEEAWIEARSASHRFRIPIDLRAVDVDSTPARARWRLYRGRKLCQVRGPIVLPGAKEARKILATSRLDAPEVTASDLFKMAAAVPDRWPAADPLALEVVYHWSVAAPRVPSGAVADALYSRWEQCDKAYAERLAKCVKGLEPRGHRSVLERLQAFVGFDQRRRELRQALAKLETRRPSTDSADPRAEVQQIEAKIDALDESEDRAAAEAQHDEKRKGAERRLRELQMERERRQDEAEQARRTEERLRERKGELSDDETVELRKAGDERQSSEKELRRLAHFIESAQREAEAPFQFERSRKTSGAGFVPKAPKARPQGLACPDEKLPTHGKLASRGGQRYLVVSTWEEALAARGDAERLRAQLVAPAGGK